MSERYDAYAELGGHPSKLNEEQKQALYRIMSLGSKQMRTDVEAENRRDADTAQHLVNKAGAALVRQAGIDRDKANGVDINSREYRLKQLKEERKRSGYS